MCCTPKICYTCLSKDNKELVNLHSTDLDKIAYNDKLKACLSTEMQEIDFKEICHSCVKLLRTSYQFIEMIKVSQETLNKYIEKVNHNTQEIKIEYIFNNTVNSDVIQIKDDNNRMCDEIQEMYNLTKNESFTKGDHTVDYQSDSSDYFLADLKGDTNCSDNISLENNHCCETCGKLTATPLEYHRHKCKKLDQKEDSSVENKNNSEPLFQCDICEFLFAKRWQLHKHQARNHLSEKKYVCNYCNKAFKQPYHLSEHVRAHTGEKNYECNYCGKKFHRISSQRRHIRSHEAAPGQKTKRTPFLCTICGKSFPFSNGVQRHMRIHLGIKKHECHLCNKKFNQSTHLHVHMRTHTGEKPYICDSCGEPFALNASLQKHMAIHQSNDQSNINLNNQFDDYTNF